MPMLSICSSNQSGDWLESLSRCLHWNMRARQKGLEEEMKLEFVAEVHDNLSPLDELAENLFSMGIGEHGKRV